MAKSNFGCLNKEYTVHTIIGNTLYGFKTLHFVLHFVIFDYLISNTQLYPVNSSYPFLFPIHTATNYSKNTFLKRNKSSSSCLKKFVGLNTDPQIFIPNYPSRWWLGMIINITNWIKSLGRQFEMSPLHLIVAYLSALCSFSVEVRNSTSSRFCSCKPLFL